MNVYKRAEDTITRMEVIEVIYLASVTNGYKLCPIWFKCRCFCIIYICNHRIICENQWYWVMLSIIFDTVHGPNQIIWYLIKVWDLINFFNIELFLLLIYTLSANEYKLKVLPLPNLTLWITLFGAPSFAESECLSSPRARKCYRLFLLCICFFILWQ